MLNEPLFELKIDAEISSYLNQSARWAKFLAIVGFVFCGLMLVLAFSAGRLIQLYAPNADPSVAPILGGTLTVIYIIFAVIWVFPFIYLFNFAGKMQRALRLVDQAELTAAFRNLKSSYRYVGIVTIVILVLYALLFVMGAASSLLTGA